VLLPTYNFQKSTDSICSQPFGRINPYPANVKNTVSF